MLNWSIKKKVWIAISAIVLIVIVTAIALVFFLYDRLYIDKQIEFLMTKGEELAEVYEEHGPTPYFNERMNWTKESGLADAIFTEDPMQLGSGIPLEPYSHENLITFEERQQLLDGEQVVMIRPHPFYHQDILGIAIPLFQDGHLSGSIFLSMPLSEVQEPFIRIRFILISSLLVVVLFIVFIGNKIIKDTVGPLNKMKQVAKTMADGDFSIRMNEFNRVDEFGQLAHSLNSLSEALEKVDENRREFLANVSHELRTPLSYMKGYVEGIVEGVIDEQKGLAIIQKESNRMERLVNDLLDLAQLEGDSYPIQCEPIALAQLISEVIESFEWITTKKNIYLSYDLDENSIVYGDPDRLEQVIRNLLDNACKYTPPYKSIHISLSIVKDASVLVIADEGSGIHEDDLANVTDRFYRIDKARTRKSGGTGLGLAIVSQIIKKHEGTFELASIVGEGTCAIITFKKH